MQTILGAGGAIGIELAKSLKAYTTDIRLVSRNPKKVNDSDILYPADLTKKDQVLQAVKDSEIVYLTVGLEYKTKVWKETWPVLMQNVINACILHKSKLVFFDNVYMIGGDNVKHITEDSPFSPVSKKGEIRAALDKMILQEIDKGKLNAIIARSADFYGPIGGNSVLSELVYKNFKKGKKAQWLANARVVHSFTYTPDAGKGTALLGNTSDAYNQIWNLPTDKSKLTGEDWIKLFAAEMGVQARYQVISPWLIKLLGLFVPIMKELSEMLYQYDRDYFFDSSKFEKRFNFRATPPAEGVRTTVQALSRA
jgi:nucleoside-diphosphate-sugar epimerase